jgi:hypothetical protein
MTNPKLGTLAQEFECESDEFESTRCKGQAKTGKPCRTVAASAGKYLFHANPNKKLVPCETPWRANFIPGSRPASRRR